MRPTAVEVSGHRRARSPRSPRRRTRRLPLGPYHGRCRFDTESPCRTRFTTPELWPTAPTRRSKCPPVVQEAACGGANSSHCWMCGCAALRGERTESLRPCRVSASLFTCIPRYILDLKVYLSQFSDHISFPLRICATQRPIGKKAMIL